MKAKKLIVLEKILRLMATAVLFVHKPKIVAITGSVGKTSTKGAVFAVLSSKYDVRENQKNYNNEIGIPLTIIGAESGGKNIFKWLWVFAKWLWAIIFPNYPEILILELGVDRPGDMKYFMSFITPTVGVVTNIGTSHLEYFETMENIAKEKGMLIEGLKSEGVALLNADDENVMKMAERTAAKVVTFGHKEGLHISASNVVYNYQDGKPAGISFKLSYDGKNMPIRLKNILAAHQVSAALAAVGTGTVFRINLVDIASALENFHSPAGRMNLLQGINGSSLIDDTYNASPISTVAALNVLQELQAQRKIAVLGDMLELGSGEKTGHREVAQKISQIQPDLFVAVGRRMQTTVEELVSLGYSKQNILHFTDPQHAGEYLAEIMREGDFVLVKGSQGMRMEKVLEKLLANPKQISKLLCRQSQEWRKKPFMNP